MISNQKLFSVGNFDFRLQHLLVIGVLILSFSISMLIRSTPLQYGFELFEFDPYFNYRATEYFLNNGYDAYSEWIDEKTWHPFGRDVSQNSQVVLHGSASVFYQLFGFNSSLYDFVIIFPMVVGSLTAIIVFAFVRVLGGTTAGLLASLMFAISVPIITRGLVGWFKSEPLGLFFAFLAIYLFVSGVMHNKGKFSFIKLIFAGLFLTLGLSAWGGILFFLIPIVAFYFSLPFIKKEKNFIIWAVPTFAVSLILFSLLFERTIAITSSYAGILIGFSTGFVIICEIIKRFSNKSSHLRNCLAFLGSIIIAVIAVFAYVINVDETIFRYLNAANPFLTTQDALTDSVAEHMTTTMTVSFGFLSVFMVFGLIGIWFLFSKKTNIKIDVRIFALITSILAIYISSTFIRLELYASIALIILGSIGLAILFKKIMGSNIFSPTKILFCAVILALFLTPMAVPEGKSWSDWADFPPTILHGGSYYLLSNSDWPDAMDWLKNNTPEDSIIASWWDYGYWITTLSERTTIVDNATLIDWQIKKMAYALITTPENSWHILNSHYSEDVSEYLGDQNMIDWANETYDDYLTRKAQGLDTDWVKIAGPIKHECEPISVTDAMKLGVSSQTCFPAGSGLDADYIVIFIAGERIDIPDSDLFFYTLDGGGDESKKHWFMKISNHEPYDFLLPDGITPNANFWQNSVLGKLIPFSVYKYVEIDTGMAVDDYRPGLIPVYLKNIKYVDPDNDPFYLVYASPSFYSEIPGPMTSVLIYKINPDYTP